MGKPSTDMEVKSNESINSPHSVCAFESPSTSTGKYSSVFHDIEYPANNTILLDGNSLTPEDLVLIGYHPEIRVDLTPEAWEAVTASRKVVDKIVNTEGYVCYGINTGFGNFANVIIPQDEIAALQRNLIVSHASGTGAPLSLTHSRMLLALRINVLAKGRSGIRPSTLQTMLQCLNANCISKIPCQGTVGASGDLAPLSHLALALLGEGDMYDPDTQSFLPAKEVLAKHNITPIDLQAKEGLALINGTQLIAALGCDALVRAKRICKTADVVAAMTVEVLRGTVRAYAPMIHDARPHTGQRLVASRMRSLLIEKSIDSATMVTPLVPGMQPGETRSELANSHRNCGKVQDSYTLRCIPQVHGICNDTVQFVYNILLTELNSATDNPMIFEEYNEFGQPYDANEDDRHLIISGGNFHGEYPAKALDYLAIGIHELASISERRIERLVNPVLSNLPAFLTPQGGLNSGYMIAHCTAASLVSENKVLCHPSSVDSISTSAAQEDHVSMGGFSARKAVEVVTNVEKVLAIELLCAAQALSLLRPLKTTVALENIYGIVRTKVAEWKEDRYMHPDIEATWKLVNSGTVWSAVKDVIPKEYR